MSLSPHSLKILAIGDQHFKVNNLRQVDEFLNKLRLWLTENTDQYDIIVSGGDLLDTMERLHIAPLNKAVEYLDLLREFAPTYVLVGNHDAVNNQIYLTDQHWLNAIKRWKEDDTCHWIEVIDRVQIRDFKLRSRNNNDNDDEEEQQEEVNSDDNTKVAKIVLAPYVPDGRFVEALGTVQSTTVQRWRDCHCVFGHQLIDGVKMGAIVAQDVEPWDDTYPMLIAFHVHDKQWIKPNVYYTGSAMQHAFNENAEKTLAVITFTPLSEDATNQYRPHTLTVHDVMLVHIHEISLGLTKKKILHIDADDIGTFDLDTLDTDHITYKIVITGSYEQFKSFRKSSKYKLLVSKGVRVTFHTRTIDITRRKEEHNQLVQQTRTRLLGEQQQHNNTTTITKVLTVYDYLHTLIENENNTDLHQFYSSTLGISMNPIPALHTPAQIN